MPETISDDEQIVLRIFRKLLDESYVDTEFQGTPRLCVDGTIHAITPEELDAMERWWETSA